MKRKPVMAGNWKMNKNNSEAVNLAQQLCYKVEPEWGREVDVVLCPPAVDIKSVCNVIAFDKAPMSVGAQNVHWEESGAYTGEISVGMIKEAGCKYCIIGHSERREMFGETDEDVNRKAKALIAAGLTPIICCGETLETRDAGLTNSFVCNQIVKALAGIAASDVERVVIAYEPIWAIGTGRVPTPEAADEVCAAIRSTIAQLFGQRAADQIRILYGGSMKPENAKFFLPMPNIDGGLIGGASLKADSFAALVQACL
ncbi:MAG: triose-phosphate isomerase [Coriobacteriales bacterium]|nr:triose-phosphate isomerase [Coriobacteriales bacterium]MBQ6586292.1 triose-phosphate isomerase [Coriobacteriales bacterium]